MSLPFTAHIFKGVRVLISKSTMENRGEWLHVSCSLPDRLPTWEEMKEVKNKFIGPDKVAVQVFPRESDFVNLHPYCLHLWSPLSSLVVGLPDLTKIVHEEAYG
jgi:hypothetical protein